ncbi:MAG: glycosyltransferase [Magnetococcales bacterium]|nr:glycosyltransferase [Magnetococcales bacterium]
MFFRKKKTPIQDLPELKKEPAKISIIITAWDEKVSMFKKAIRALGTESLPEYEIIAVINRYEDNPEKTQALLEVAKTEPAVSRWCEISQNAGVVRAWNIGVQLAEGDIYLIVNGDCIVKKGCLAAMFKPFSSPKTGIVGVGSVRNKKRSDEPGPCDDVYGFLFALRREVYETAGPFDNGFSPLADEREYCLRAGTKGWIIEVADGAKYFHEYTISEQVDRDIRHMGRHINRKWLDKHNNDRKKDIPWMPE